MGTSEKPNALSREERKLMANLSASRKVRDKKRQGSKKFMNRQAKIGNLVEWMKNAGCDLWDHACQEQLEQLLTNICCHSAIQFLAIGRRRKGEDQLFRRCVNCVLFLVLAGRSVIL
jgi:hypothetical protein